jgi:hypothetical protein
VSCATTALRIPADRTTRVRLTIGATCASIVAHAAKRRITARLTSRLSSGQRALASTVALADPTRSR